MFLVRCPACGSRLIQPLDVASPIRGSSIVARFCPECELRDVVVADDIAIHVWLHRDEQIRAWLGDVANALAGQARGLAHQSPPRATRPRRASRGLATGEQPVFVVSPTMQVVAWNSALEKLTGRRAHDAVGRPCHDVMISISHGEPPSCCGAQCPLRDGQRQSPSSDDVGFDLETRSGARPAMLATIREDGDDLLHVVQTPH